MIQKHLKHLSLFISKFTSSSLKAKAAKGGLWLGMGSISENGARFIRNFILARVLLPSDFGLMAMTMALCQLFESFTQMGIKEAIIQNPKGNDDTFLNGAFYISAIRGIALYGIAYATAPLVTLFYHKPELLPLMRVTFLAILFNSFMSIKVYTEQKNLHYRRWTIVNHGGALLGIIVAIIMGFIYKNVWGLVIGFVVESFFRFILSYCLCFYIPRFVFTKEHMQSLLQFSKGIFGLPILFFLYNKMDVFVLGKFCTDGEIGKYSLVQSLALMPYTIFSGIVTQLLMPIYSAFNEDMHQLRVKYKRISRLISMLFFPLLVLLASFSSLLLTLSYGKEYSNGSPLFMMFCCSIALQVHGANACSLFFSLAKPHIYRAATFTRFIVMCIIIVPCVKLWGTFGAACAIVFSLSIWLLIVIYKIKQTTQLTYRRQIGAFLPGLGLGCIALLVSWIIQKIIPFESFVTIKSFLPF